MSKKLKIDFKMTPKVTWVTSDTPDYDDFVSNWKECHEDWDEPPAEGSQAFYEAVSEEQAIFWDDFKTNFENCHLIGKTCLFMGRYNSRYPEFQPSCDAGNVIRIDSIDDFMKFTGDHPDHVDIWSDKDGLHVQNAHHDGTLSLVVNRLRGSHHSKSELSPMLSGPPREGTSRRIATPGTSRDEGTTHAGLNPVRRERVAGATVNCIV